MIDIWKVVTFGGGESWHIEATEKVDIWIMEKRKENFKYIKYFNRIYILYSMIELIIKESGGDWGGRRRLNTWLHIYTQ